MSHIDDFDEFSSTLIKKIGLSGGLKNFALIIFFFSREVLMINWLGEEVANIYGIFAGYSAAIISFILITPNVLPKFYQEFGEEGRKLCNKIVAKLLLINFVLVDLVLLILSITSSRFNITSFPTFLFLVLLSLNAVLPLIYKIIESGMYGLKAAKEIGISYLFLSFLFTILLLFLYYINKISFNTVIWIFIVSYVIGIVISGYFLHKLFLSVAQFKKNDNQLPNQSLSETNLTKKIIIFSLPLFWANLFYFLNYRLGNILLSFLGGNSVIYYHISTNIILMFIGLIGLPINDMIFPYISEAHQNKDLHKIKKIYHFIFPLIALFLIGGLLIIYSLSPIIISLIYPAYFHPEFVSLFRIFIIGGFFYCLNQFFGRIPIAKGKTKVVFIGQSLAGLTNVLFLYISMTFENLLISGYGFVFSSMVMSIIYISDYLKTSTENLWEIKIPQVILSIILSILIFNLFLVIFNDSYILSSIFCLMTFIGLLFLFKIMSLKKIKFIFLAFFSLISSIMLKKNKWR